MTDPTIISNMSEPLLMISVQSQRLLIVARLVREVLGERTWVPLPGTRHELPGVVGWGRRAVAMLDLARVLPNLRPLSPSERRSRTLLLEVEGSHLAVPADGVSAIFDIEASAIHPRSLITFPLCRSEVHVDGEVLPLFDPSLLLNQPGVA